jgi:hypothetical protein
MTDAVVFQSAICGSSDSFRDISRKPGLLTPGRGKGRTSLVETRWVTFEELQRDKCEAREEDARRLRLGLVTPEELEDENSLIPRGTPISVIALCEAVERYYGK